MKKKKIQKKKTRKIGKKGVSLSRTNVTYTLNPEFEFYYELKNLILKSSPGEKDEMVNKIMHLGKIKLAVVSGVFLNEPDQPEVSDLFIVGDDIDRQKLNRFLKYLEALVGKEIKFTLMDKEEFKYRHGMFDRFIRVLLEGPHEKLVDRLGI